MTCYCTYIYCFVCILETIGDYRSPLPTLLQAIVSHACAKFRHSLKHVKCTLQCVYIRVSYRLTLLPPCLLIPTRHSPHTQHVEAAPYFNPGFFILIRTIYTSFSPFSQLLARLVTHIAPDLMRDIPSPRYISSTPSTVLTYGRTASLLYATRAGLCLY